MRPTARLLIKAIQTARVPENWIAIPKNGGVRDYGTRSTVVNRNGRPRGARLPCSRTCALYSGLQHPRSAPIGAS